jgi:heme-degrading monooxygenase HmoA
MVTIGMGYKVIPGKEETFANACNGVIKAMDGMDGHKKSFLYKDVNDGQSFLIVSEWDVNDGQSFLIVSEWDDKDAFDAFIGSDTFKNVTNWGKEQILAGRPSHTVYKH